MTESAYTNLEGKEGGCLVSISPVQWSNLKDIDDVEPINDSDAECMQEIRDVLKRHGKLDRFGVALLHSHFELGEDEIMLEASDEEKRTLLIQPATRSEAGTNNIATIWQLRQEGLFASTWCHQYCKKPEYWQASHRNAHAKRRG